MFNKILKVLVLIVFLVFGCFNHEDIGDICDTPQPTTTDLVFEEDTGKVMENNCKLLLNNKEICNDCYVNINFEQRYAELPVIKILTEMGASVIWHNEFSANIVINDNEYVLNTNETTLKKYGAKANLLVVAPGSNHGMISKKVSGDFICDSDTLLYFFVYEIGAKINIDYEQALINIYFELE